MALKFEDLRVWPKALDLSFSIHELTRSFPKDELFILTQHIKRAADSVALNIAEGSQRQSNAEQNKFLGYALRSAIEVVCCLYLGRRRMLLSEDHFQSLYDEFVSLIISIQSFRKTLF
jgi:four helix bundle protein